MLERAAGGVLAERALEGDRRALARLLSLVEDGTPEGQQALATLFPRAGRAHVIGFTGSTGAGKSTLLNRVARAFGERGEKVAVVAVDPTSPLSGGALLGDRIRMRDLAGDPDIFIRSMASRGHPGGVAHATRDVITVLDAVGFPVVLVETVGAGQAQVEVARVTHTVVLVEAPGMGDDIQALKAGLLEIADVIVVNKADRPEARRTVSALQTLRGAGSAGHHRRGSEASEPAEAAWQVPILETSALSGEGVDALVDAITAHKSYLQTGQGWEAIRARHARAEVETWLLRHFQTIFYDRMDPQWVEAQIQAVVNRERDPSGVARDLLEAFLEGTDTS